jgi:hypothetical protein
VTAPRLTFTALDGPEAEAALTAAIDAGDPHYDPDTSRHYAALALEHLNEADVVLCREALADDPPPPWRPPDPTTTVLVDVGDLVPGLMVDAEGDEYADDPMWACVSCGAAVVPCGGHWTHDGGLHACCDDPASTLALAGDPLSPYVDTYRIVWRVNHPDVLDGMGGELVEWTDGDLTRFPPGHKVKVSASFDPTAVPDAEG